MRKHSVTYSVKPMFFGLLWAVKEHYKVSNGYYDKRYIDTVTLHASYNGALASYQRIVSIGKR